MKSYTTPTIRINLSEPSEDSPCGCREAEEVSGVLDDATEIRVAILSENGSSKDYAWPVFGSRISIEGDSILVHLSEGDAAELVGRCEIEATVKNLGGEIFKTSTKKVTIKNSLRNAPFDEKWPEGDEEDQPPETPADIRTSFYNLPVVFDEVLAGGTKLSIQLENPAMKIRMVFLHRYSIDSVAVSDNTIYVNTLHGGMFSTFYGATSTGTVGGGVGGEILFDNSTEVPVYIGTAFNNVNNFFSNGTSQQRIFDFFDDAMVHSKDPIVEITSRQAFAPGTRVIVYAS